MFVERHFNSIVFVHHGLGDVAMALPLLRNLACEAKKIGPTLVLVKSDLERNFLELAEVDKDMQVEIFPRCHPLKTAVILRRRRLKLALAPHAAPGIKMAAFFRVMNASLSVGPKGPFSLVGYDRTLQVVPGMHKTHYYLSFAKTAGINISQQVPSSLKVKPKIEDLSSTLTTYPLMGKANTLIGIAPGSGEAEKHKRWPIQAFAELIRSTIADYSNVGIFLFGAPAEIRLLERLKTDIGAPKCVSIIAEPNLSRSMAILSRMDVLVTNCNGAAHLAAALQVPVVGIYGPTNAGFTGPCSDKFYHVRANLPCSPCYDKDFISGCGSPVCMRTLEVKDVRMSLDAALQGKIPAPVPWIPTIKSRSPRKIN